MNAEPSKLSEINSITIDYEIPDNGAWHHKVDGLKGWIHLDPMVENTTKVSEDYYIPYVPFFVVLDSITKEILAVPENTEELAKFIGAE